MFTECPEENTRESRVFHRAPGRKNFPKCFIVHSGDAEKEPLVVHMKMGNQHNQNGVKYSPECIS